MIKKLFKKLSFNQKYNLLHTTDLHSHLIPEIDDGTKSLDESVDIIRHLKELGFKKIITTPHIMSHRFPNTQNSIHEGYELLVKELRKQKIDIDIEVAAEYYYDEHFVELINNKEILTFGDNYMLFELSYHIKPLGLEQTVSKLLNAGYKPILAHPERYTFYRSAQDYEMLKDMGLFFQINAISIQGFYGKKVQKAVENIIDLGMVDFIGSDIHSHRYLEVFSKALRSKIYLKIMKNNQIKNEYL